MLDDRSSTKQKSTDNLHLAARLRRALLGFVSPPPVAGAVAGLLIATCPPLRELFVGSDAPLGVAFKAVERFAGGYLPSASLCLAGSLVSGAGASVASVLASAYHSNDDNDELASSKSIAELHEPLDIGFKQRIAVICAARFVVMPLIGAGALQLLAAANLLLSPAAQPVLWFFLLTQFSMPPAQNSVVMLQVAGKPEGATRMARTLFLVYAFSTVPLALLFHAHIKACELF